jgi:hypothetical protein
MTTESNGGMISTEETPHSSTRVLWQIYQQTHLEAKQEEHGEGNTEYYSGVHLSFSKVSQQAIGLHL